MSDDMDQRIDVFFYGLFMDEDLLRQKGTAPTNRRYAHVESYTLVIGERATIVQGAGDSVHGVVFSLTQAEIDSLYSEPSVQDYRPEPVLAHLTDGTVIPAVCFNLRELRAGDKPNSEYAANLRALTARLGFPQSYIDKIR